MSAAPLVLEPVVGWRLWHVAVGAEGYRLESWTRGDEWPAGRRTEARCRRHGAPLASHRCGVYAFRTREAAQRLLARCAPGGFAGCRPVALGAVSLWGRVIPHSDGWRGQYAYPYELLVLGGDDDVARNLRRRYAVDVSAA
jgi:hypothetical protein